MKKFLLWSVFGLGFLVSAGVSVVVLLALLSPYRSSQEVSAPAKPSWSDKRKAKSLYEASASALAEAVRRGGQCPERILSNLERASALDPSAAEYHIGLGAAYGSCGMLDKAITEFQVAQMLDPRSPEAAENLSKALRIRDEQRLTARLMAPADSCQEFRARYLRNEHAQREAPAGCYHDDIISLWEARRRLREPYKPTVRMN